MFLEVGGDLGGLVGGLVEDVAEAAARGVVAEVVWEEDAGFGLGGEGVVEYLGGGRDDG